jgi:phytochrome-interacting factor 3
VAGHPYGQGGGPANPISPQKKEKKKGFPTIKMQKKDPMRLSSNSNLMNFSHFSRPATLMKANLENIGQMAASGLSSMERMASKEKG